LTGLDGLASSRNAGSGAAVGAVTTAAKDGSGSEPRQRAGDTGTFTDILSSLSRRDAQDAGTTVSALSAPDPERTLPSAATDPDSSMAAFVDRVSGTGSRSHQGEATPPSDARNTGSAPIHDGACGLHGETDRPDVTASGGLDLPRRRICTDTSSSEPAGTDSPVPVTDQTGPMAGLGTGLGLSPPTGVLSSESNAGLQSFVPEGPADTSVETVLSPQANTAEAVLASSAPSDQASPPQDIRRDARGKSNDAVLDVGISQSPKSVDVARQLDSAAPILSGPEDRPVLRALPREQVTVLAAEAHFPPVVSYSPIDQIIPRIAAELGTGITPADPKRLPGSAGAGREPREATTCVRSLTVILEPASLGPITIKLRLSGTTLGLEIEADERETTRLIGRGRQTLTEKLRAVGLSVDTFVVSDNVRARRTF
jgi:hypothetical protein